MKPLDDEQLAELKAAYQEVHGTRMWSEFEKKLRPRPKFGKGQVVAVGNAVGPYGYQLYENIHSEKQKFRPLTQTEVGPDWVPKEDVKALRDAMEKLTEAKWLGRGDADAWSEVVVNMTRLAAEALAAFDAKHWGE